MSLPRTPLLFVRAMVPLWALAGCGPSVPELDRRAAGESLHVPLPAPRVQSFAEAETLSAHAAEWLNGLERRLNDGMEFTTAGNHSRWWPRNTTAARHPDHQQIAASGL